MKNPLTIRRLSRLPTVRLSDCPTRLTRPTVRRSDRPTVLFALFALFASSASAQTIAITGGTVYTASGPRIENGTVIIRDGKLAAVGRDVAIPADAVRVDAAGKWVTPGLIQSEANAGLGVRGLGGLGEGRVEGQINPSFSPADAYDPAAVDVPITRTGGVTTAVEGPGGGILPGQAFVVDMAGDRIEDAIAKRGAALLLDLSDGSRQAGGGSRAGAIARVRQLFADAQEYARRKAEFQRAAIQPLAAPAKELEALLPALRGQQIVAIAANRRIDIENALRLVRDYKLKAVLLGAVEGWQVARDIAAAGIPTIVEPLRDIPDFGGLGARLDNATLLKEAGVKVILAGADGGGERNLRYGAGNAVRNGMIWGDALRAITAEPAAAFGLTDRGTLEVGKVANVVVWSGDPFEFSSRAERVYIRGAETSLKTRETELRDKYRTLPPVP